MDETAIGAIVAAKLTAVLAVVGTSAPDDKLRCCCVVGERLCDATVVTMIDAAGVDGRCCLPIKPMASPEVMGDVDVA